MYTDEFKPVGNIFSTLVDFEPYPSAIVFFKGCNLYCPYCYNKDLLFPFCKRLSGYSLDEALDVIKSMRQFIDGVVLSGGEPLLYQDMIIDFVNELNNMDLKVKLDTNGTIPVKQQLLNLLYGVSLTLKPASYYPSETILDVIRDNIVKFTTLPWKELRVTVVDDKTLIDVCRDFKTFKLLQSWNLRITNAVKTDSILDPEKVRFIDDSDKFFKVAETISNLIPHNNCEVYHV